MKSFKKPLPSKQQYYRMLLKRTFFSLSFLAVSLGMGIGGYHYYCNFSWIDSFLNASMILGGMGPVNTNLNSNAGKLFSSFYALYSGIAFLTNAAIFFVPVFHRFLHKFHLDLEQEN